MDDIEVIIQRDYGSRGLKNLWTHQLNEAILTLSKSSKIIIATGFYIPTSQAGETDGPPGAISIARALLALNKEVSIITDQHTQTIVSAAIQQSKLRIPLLIYPMNREDEDQYIKDILSTGVDCLVSIERLGRAKDGRYYSMRAIDNSMNTARIDSLFIYVQQNPQCGIKLIGIGDGGNEIGMGNVLPLVNVYVPNGEIIGTVVTCDHLICAGVSNWGGYAIAVGLYRHTQVSNSAKNLENMLPNSNEEREIIAAMVEAGAVDGVLGKCEISVDGMPFEVHKLLLEELLRCVEYERS